MLSCLLSFVFFGSPQVGVAATRADMPWGYRSAVPANATDVHYVLPGIGGPTTIYEFELSEPDFIAWTDAIGFPATPIGAMPAKLMNFGHLWGGLQQPTELVVTNGLIHHTRFEPDAALTIVYDRDHGKVYYHRHTR